MTNIIITAYCACQICCGPHASGLTASGKAPIQGVTVAASRKIPFGSHIRIQGLTNDFIVQDRLAKRYDNRVDIYFDKHSDARAFGKQLKQITIYAKY